MPRSIALLSLLCALPACGGSETATASDSGVRDDTSTAPDTDTEADLGVVDEGLEAPSGDATGDGDAASDDVSGDAGGDAPDAPPDAVTDGADSGLTYRNSLSVCWTDPTCTRALAIAHGGDWVVTGPPYDSNAALTSAWVKGADGIKIDVRVTADNVPVISHSSPLLSYESLDCMGKKIETSTAAEITKCHRFPSTTETFQRLGDVLDAFKGKLVIQLCVKVSTDYARTIAEVLAHGAQDYAFIEIPTGDLQKIIPTTKDGDKVWYLVQIGSTLTDVDLLLGTIKNPRAFMYEFDPTVAMSTLAKTKLHPAGVRTFTYDNSSTVTSADLKAHYDDGYDVVSSNLVPNVIAARVAVNKARGITPP